MPNEFASALEPVEGRWAIVVSTYNESITSRLLDGALATLTEHGVADERIDVARVPGAYEIPLVADRLAGSGQYAAVLCLGAVIRGETTHDEHINRAVSVGLMRAGVDSGVPVLFGVLTCDTLEQAIQRAGGTVGNKGSECADAALRMASLLAQLPPKMPT
ncbi:MAG: 6,7-dimethyl-8-ribityllumazine synthase [Pirellulales bacterium]|nr:6,7-dimethyl-8-ribityllumazine synthase [Planctomycetales bacterium]